MNKNLLITGLSGFVGSNLYYYLLEQKSCAITGMSRNKHALASRMNELSEAVNHEELFAGIKTGYDAYIHLAGKAHDLKGISDDSEYFKVNYELTKKLYDQFLEDASAKVFVFVSSVKAAADTVEGELTEEVTPDPVTVYGKSKLKAEEYILSKLPGDRTVVILRPYMIHGPGNKGNLNELYGMISKGTPYPLGAFENRRSFLSIENLCFVIHEILGGKIPSGIYHIADDEPVSTRELVTLTSEVLHKEPRIWNIPRLLIRAGAKLGNILPLPLNDERLQKLTENYVVSNKKLVSALGKPLPVKAREGLRKTLESF